MCQIRIECSLTSLTEATVSKNCFIVLCEDDRCPSRLKLKTLLSATPQRTFPTVGASLTELKCDVLCFVECSSLAHIATLSCRNIPTLLKSTMSNKKKRKSKATSPRA